MLITVRAQGVKCASNTLVKKCISKKKPSDFCSLNSVLKLVQCVN